MLELRCQAPNFWDLTREEYEALTDHWRIMMTREGYKVPKPDTPEIRKAEQSAFASALRTLTEKQAHAQRPSSH